MSAKLRYAYNPISRVIVPVERAYNGLRCGCICLDCGQPLEAVQGQINEQHYRHAVDKGCSGCGESLLHLRAKRLIYGGNKMAIPGRMLHYYDAVLEEPIGPFVADVWFKEGEMSWYLEVIVTHRPTAAKADYYVRSRIPVILIDLSRIDPNITDETLAEILAYDSSVKEVPKIKEAAAPYSQHESVSSWIVVLLVLLCGYALAFHPKRRKR